MLSAPLRRGVRASGGLFLGGGDLTYRIKNWDRFQHYKNKKEGAHLPWIKLYRSLLDDPEFHSLKGDQVKHLVMFWMIASDADGALPPIHRLSFQMRLPISKVKDSLSALSHWLYDDSRVALEPDYSPSSDEAPKSKSKSKSKSKRRVREDKEPPLPPKGERVSDLLFDSFWKEYPRKIAKPAARRAWDRIRPNDELLRVMVEAIGAQKETHQWVKDDGEFIPHPATWLNQRRWEDEIAPEEPKEGSWIEQSMTEIENKKTPVS